jgi:hypothetical protein
MPNRLQPARGFTDANENSSERGNAEYGNCAL